MQKDGTSLQLNRIETENGNLTIVNVTREDRGIYQCSAQVLQKNYVNKLLLYNIFFKNEAATISTDTEIMLHNVAPFPPYNLTGI